MQKEEITRKNVRIVRTLGPTDLDSTLEMLVRKTGVHVWPGKVRYTISVPGIAFAYGTYVEFKYCLSHLLQGYKVEKIVTLLKEAQLLTLVEKDGSQGRFRNTRTVAEDDYCRSLFSIDMLRSLLTYDYADPWNANSISCKPGEPAKIR